MNVVFAIVVSFAIVITGKFLYFSSYTVDPVIFACLDFREFLILELFTKFRIREFSFSFSSAIIIIRFARFKSGTICTSNRGSLFQFCDTSCKRTVKKRKDNSQNSNSEQIHFTF